MWSLEQSLRKWLKNLSQTTQSNFNDRLENMHLADTGVSSIQQHWPIFSKMNVSHPWKCWQEGGSKRATRAQKQTAWAPRLQNLTKMLEPHLVEIKHQRESKFWHPEPLACGKLLHTMLHWENRRAPTASRCQLQICLEDIWQTKQVSAKHHAELP
jgi:hypothetical protein